MKYLPKSILGAAVAGAYLLLAFGLLGGVIFGSGGLHGSAAIASLFAIILTAPLSLLAVGLVDSLPAANEFKEYLAVGSLAVCAVVNAVAIYLLVGFVSQISMTFLRRLRNKIRGEGLKCFFLIPAMLTFFSINGLAQNESFEDVEAFLKTTAKRLENETAESFAKRIGPPQSELVHTAIETEVWGQKKTVIAFYKIEFKLKDGTPATRVDGYLFVPNSSDTYQKILIKNFEEEGDTPEIEAVFFANADKDKTPELIVICSWKQVHYDVNGTLYGTFVFDDAPPGTDSIRLTFLEKVSDKVSGGCDCTYRDGTKGTKKFQTARQVRAGLKRLGFR